MNTAPTLIRQHDREYPLWLISNFSFDFHQEHKRLLEHVQSQNRGLQYRLITMSSEAYLPQSHHNWGVIPIFDPNMSPDEIAIFFSHLIDRRSPLLTMFVEPNLNVSSNDLQLIDVSFGKIMSATRLDSFSSGEDLMTYIKSKLKFFDLARKSMDLRTPVKDVQKNNGKYEWSQILPELEYLEAHGGCITTRGKFKLYLTQFKDLKVIPYEIGRLRAITYEEIGEGTGKAIDLDDFDQSYHQLFLVDFEEGSIVGGYRIGPCDQLLQQYGIEGLYTNALYHIHTSVHQLLAQSIELGRSFVVANYQKKQMPLFLLWNGILQFLKQNQQYRHIVGLVSISRVYSEVSRSLIINYLKRHHFDAKLAENFTPRQEYYSTSADDSLDTIIKVFNGELIHLDEFIADIEPENYRLPVLIRKYINQNARFIGFNLDPDFSNCVDGLMVLDIDKLPVSTIQLLQDK